MSEVRLIDANALKYKNLAEVNGKLTYVLTAEEINNAPTVDCSNELSEMTFSHALTTEERQDLTRAFLIGKRSEQRPQGKWGKWIVAEVQCPNCFEYFEVDYYSAEELNNCPNCGAKMKGGAE